MPDKKYYLGDDVYASFNGYQIWLSTQQGMEIALEPDVFENLLNYKNLLAAEFLKDTSNG